MPFPTDLAGQRVTVMGLGNFGGGAGVTRWLARQGADVLVTDLTPAEKLADSVHALHDLTSSGRVRLRLGEHNVSDFTNTDLVVANPAVPKPWDNRYLRAASAARVPITTEIRLLAERLPNRERTVGITGSAGKSTTTAMTAEILASASGHRTHVGGNLGGSLLSVLDRIGPEDWVVLELSSAMLHWLGPAVGDPDAQPWSPAIAACTNLSPNHLDWHGELPHYRASKQRIFDPFGGGSRHWAILHESIADWPTHARSTIIVRDTDAQTVGALQVPGRHNRGNAAMALAIARCAGVRESSGREALDGFRGLAHRLESVDIPGARFRVFNDSKSTTPESAALAIAAMDDEPGLGAPRTHLIAGGYDKKIDLAPMIAPAARCAGVYTVGATGPALADRIASAGGRARFCQTIEHAVRDAAQAMNPGDALLLSPGCASWDQFTNFEDRGRAFTDAARQALAR
ncbi:MAG: UDP-N-acetylmuramoyl-L-alanine--D-glutamate ligase [Phycisphaerales bacterium]|nr:UDP-N-acetylmuramoyl-L-alanine--D-glutamate ligase [Phycisphaerales bacterium]